MATPRDIPPERVADDETVVQPMSPAARRVHEEYVSEAPPPPARHNDIWGWLAAALFAILAIVAGVYALTRPHTRTVPAVIGMSPASAEARLHDAGFAVDVVSVARLHGGATVLQQSPNSGAKLEKGAHALIVVPRAATVKLPTLVGLRAEGAARLLKSLKLQGQPTVVASDKPRGTVLQQAQAPGTKVSAGMVVQYTVSQGPKLVAMPALRGLSRDKAQAQLAAAGLTASFRDVQSAEKPDTVVAQSVAPGQKVKPGLPVTVNVSAGAGQVTVPDVTGQDQSQALATLQQAGLKVALVSVQGAQPQGTVVRQSPAANSQVQKGSTVQLSTSDGSLGSGAGAATDTSPSTG